MNLKPTIFATARALLPTFAIQADAAAQSGASQPVTADNFVRAETDVYFGNFRKDGGFGKFAHNREPTPINSRSSSAPRNPTKKTRCASSAKSANASRAKLGSLLPGS